MDLRTKLVLSIVGVSLAGMLGLGLLSFGPARDVWRESALEGLLAIASSKQSDIENVAQAWSNHVLLIGSRTRLRFLVEEFSRSHSPVAAAEAKRIVTDAQQAVLESDVREITVYDRDLHPVVTTLADGTQGLPGLDAELRPEPGAEVRFLGFRLDPSGGIPEALYTVTLSMDGARVGTAFIRLGAEELLQVASDYEGLGDTGETLLSRVDASGDVILLHPPRHAPDEDIPMVLTNADDPAVRAATEPGLDAVFETTVDYRGARVWAAGRHVPSLGLGLVVKFDATEQEEPLHQLRDIIMQTAVALAGIAVLFGILIGLHFARPLQELASIAGRIREGELDIRAPVRGEDEIGSLAEAFNEMTEKLVATNRELQRRIDEQGEGARSNGDVEDQGSGARTAPGDPRDTS